MEIKNRWQRWKTKRNYAYTFDWVLKGMKSWQEFYIKKSDAQVSSRIVNLWLQGNFATERVIVVHLKSHKTEEWVLITRK